MQNIGVDSGHEQTSSARARNKAPQRERESETRERERGLKDTKRRKGGVGCGSSEQAAALGLQADNEGSGFLE